MRRPILLTVLCELPYLVGKRITVFAKAAWRVDFAVRCAVLIELLVQLRPREVGRRQGECVAFRVNDTEVGGVALVAGVVLPFGLYHLVAAPPDTVHATVDVRSGEPFEITFVSEGRPPRGSDRGGHRAGAPRETSRQPGR